MNKTIRHSDSLQKKDELLQFEVQKPGFRTEIIGGYDPYVDRNGVTQLGETLFETENSIVLGGALFVLEKVFGI
ncbi:hypothetical protein PJM52_29320, partial [Mycobacterium kansasii]